MSKNLPDEWDTISETDISKPESKREIDYSFITDPNKKHRLTPTQVDHYLEHNLGILHNFSNINYDGIDYLEQKDDISLPNKRIICQTTNNYNENSKEYILSGGKNIASVLAPLKIALLDENGRPKDGKPLEIYIPCANKWIEHFNTMKITIDQNGKTSIETIDSMGGIRGFIFKLYNKFIAPGNKEVAEALGKSPTEVSHSVTMTSNQKDQYNCGRFTIANIIQNITNKENFTSKDEEKDSNLRQIEFYGNSKNEVETQYSPHMPDINIPNPGIKLDDTATISSNLPSSPSYNHHSTTHYK